MAFEQDNFLGRSSSSDLAAEIDALKDRALFRDGSKAMSGNLSIGANEVINVADVQLNAVVSGATPSSGITIYAKSDNILYQKTSGGVESAVGGGGGGGITTPATTVFNNIVTWDDSTGSAIADSGRDFDDIVEGPGAATDGGNVVFDTTSGKLIKGSTSLVNLTVDNLKTGTDANTISTSGATPYLAFRNGGGSDYKSMICLGSGAGASWTIDQASDGHNVAIGFDAMNLANQPNSLNNVAIGTEALADASGAACQSNVAIGTKSLKALADGSGRVSIGQSSQENNTNSTSLKQNVSLGSFTLNKGTNLEKNTALGTNALRYLNTTGVLAENNIAIGHGAGANFTSTESDNICLGANGVVLDQGAIRIGTFVNHTSCFIQGISGVSLPTAKTVTVDGGGQLGYREFGQLISIPFGADMDSINRYAVGNGKAEEKDENSKEETRMPLMGGKLLKLLYKTQQADATTELEVVINGLGTTTVALTGDSGVADLDITVLDGNWAEIKYSAGTSPERSTFLLILGVTGFS